MKKILLFLIVFFLANHLSAQDTTSNKLIFFGAEMGVLNIKYTPPNEPTQRLLTVRASPFIGCFFNNKWSAGFSGSYRFMKGDSYFRIQNPTYGMGVYVQYLHRLKPKSTNTFMRRFLGLGRVVYHRTNYYLGWENKEFTHLVSDRLTENALFFDVGLSVRIFKQFYLENFIRYDLFFQRSHLLTYRNGISYHFGS